MKKFYYLFMLALVATCALTLSSCSEEEVEGNITKATMIVKNWEYSSIQGHELPDCLKDDVYNFKSDGTFSINVGTSTCFGETNQEGNWQLSTDGKQLSLKVGAITTNYEVVDIALDKLVLKMTIGDMGLVEVTFK